MASNVQTSAPMKVLVIEDDRSVRETLGMVLECYDIEPTLVEDAESALKSLEKSWPDVLLLDLTLVGMTGEEVYRQIQARFHSVPPTVVLSAVQHGEKRVHGMDGARFLAKPYTLEQLLDSVKLAAHQAGAA